MSTTYVRWNRKWEGLQGKSKGETGATMVIPEWLEAKDRDEMAREERIVHVLGELKRELRRKTEYSEAEIQRALSRTEEVLRSPEYHDPQLQELEEYARIYLGEQSGGVLSYRGEKDPKELRRRLLYGD